MNLDSTFPRPATRTQQASSRPEMPATAFRRARSGFLFVAILFALQAATVAWGQDPAADRLWREAHRQEASDRYAAVEAYELLVRQFPGDALAPRALLRIVEIRREDRDPQRTDLALDQLIDGYGRSPEAASGYLIRGEILTEVARSTADLEAARAALRRVPLLFGRERFPSLSVRGEALYRSGVLARRLGDDDSAAADFLAVLEDQPDGPRTARARLSIGTLLIDRGDWKEGSEILQRLVDGPPGPTTTASEDGSEATASTPQADDSMERQAASRRLSLLHRRTLRPLSGERLLKGGTAFARGLSLDDANGVAAHEDGRLLVTDPGQQTIAVIDRQGKVQMRANLRGLGAPFWDEEKATAAGDTALVQPFGGGGRTFRSPDRDAPLKGVSTVARDDLGQYFVIAKGQPGVLRYQDGRHRGSLLVASRQDVVDLASDGRGRVLALDKRTGEVRRIKPDGTGTTLVLRDTWKRPSAVAGDAMGYVFVADRGTGTIQLYDPAGNRATTIGPLLDDGTELRAPIDLAVDGEGRLFVLDARLPHLLVFE